MSERSRQLVLDWPVPPRFDPEDFLVGPTNERAVRILGEWPRWPANLLHLRGPAGSGKSHLAAIWAGRAGASRTGAAALTFEAVPALAAAGAVLIEDLDRDGVPDGSCRDERALFHLLNIAREGNASVLVTSATAVDGTGIRLPDLLSRLRLAPSVVLEPPDDLLLKAVLVKLFGDRQLAVEAGVVDYLALRMERSIAEASSLVAALDREALSRGRRVTRSVAAAVLAARHEGGHHTDVTKEQDDDSH